MEQILASSTCIVVDSSTTDCQYFGVSTSSPAVYSGVVTAGDVLVAFMVFVLVVLYILVNTIKSL